MAEVAVKGCHDIESKPAEAQISSAKQSRALAVVVALIAITAATAFFAGGNAVAGGFMVSMPVVMLVRSMVGR